MNHMLKLNSIDIFQEELEIEVQLLSFFFLIFRK